LVLRMKNNNPLEIFRDWFDKAGKADIDKPNAMTLSTVDSTGSPNARIVLLSSYDSNGFVFHTNYKSEKGAELAENSSACLLFWWDEIGFQVRINGEVSKTTAEESDTYFKNRPRGSQVGAWASEQSQEIKSRQVLEDRVMEFEKKFEGKDVPRPKHWGGYVLVPDKFEFWINRDSRLHDRYLYTRGKNNDWQKKILAP
jgi:pyridoxamine 5'-phosphate oxidase